MVLLAWNALKVGTAWVVTRAKTALQVSSARPIATIVASAQKPVRSQIYRWLLPFAKAVLWVVTRVATGSSVQTAGETRTA